MNGTAHASYSFLSFTLFSILLTGKLPSPEVSFLSLLFGLFPDVDGLYWKLRSREGADENQFQHHLYYPTHWPVTYLPLVGWTLVTYFLDFFFIAFLAITWGIYCHLLADSIACGDGMNWGAPWGKRFVNLFSDTTDGYHGKYWAIRYRKTIFFKLENLAAVLSIILLVFQLASLPENWGFIVAGIAGLSILIGTGFFPIDEKYLGEPPGGRYNDYRRIKEFYDRLPPKKKRMVKEWLNRREST